MSRTYEHLTPRTTQAKLPPGGCSLKMAPPNRPGSSKYQQRSADSVFAWFQAGRQQPGQFSKMAEEQQVTHVKPTYKVTVTGTPKGRHKLRHGTKRTNTESPKFDLQSYISNYKGKSINSTRLQLATDISQAELSFADYFSLPHAAHLYGKKQLDWLLQKRRKARMSTTIKMQSLCTLGPRAKTRKISQTRAGCPSRRSRMLLNQKDWRMS